MKTARHIKAWRLILLTALWPGLSSATQAAVQERAFLLDLNSRDVTELELPGDNSLDGRFPIIGLSINDHGQVAGYSGLDLSTGDSQAFVTGFDGVGITYLRGLRTIRSFTLPSDINNAGNIVGESATVEGNRHAFISGPDDAGMRNLGTLPGGRYSFAYGINNSGQVVGHSDSTEGLHAFITGPNGVGMRDLGTLGGRESFAFGINDAGQVVGYAGTGAFITGPNGVGMTPIEPLDDRSPNITLEDQAPPSINNSGQVAGSSLVFQSSDPFGRWQTFVSHAFVTGANGTGVTDLGTLGGDESYGTAINDAGQVVGWAETQEGIRHAFITGPDGTGMTDLNLVFGLPHGVILTETMDINNMGQVVVVAIPEPHTYAMLLPGLILLCILSFRKKPTGYGQSMAVVEAPAFLAAPIVFLTLVLTGIGVSGLST
jgi:probable HAF family extracellular repeat protein